MCGGTFPAFHRDGRLAGLSPRVRGNHCAGVSPVSAVRSIPACAGEPRIMPIIRAIDRVYPRVCGGTFACKMPRLPVQGLSPRVRGNPARAGVQWQQRGSIPACAGEPRENTPPLYGIPVYPRVCGGTKRPWRGCMVFQGLSPRVRGNPTFGIFINAPPGSIPACAGEPLTPVPPLTAARVYPRVCGGTAGYCHIVFC